METFPPDPRLPATAPPAATRGGRGPGAFPASPSPAGLSTSTLPRTSPALAGSLAGWSVPGTWAQREAPQEDGPTLALPDACRAFPVEPPRDLFEGWRRYEDRELVGIGGMGRVYRARDPRDGRTVALKFLVETGRDGAAGQREPDLQARVRHPGVLPVLDRGTLHHYPWFAMPFVQGRTLRALRREGGLGVESAVALLVEVARTVEAIHRAGVVHCDLNPRNVLVAGTGDGSPGRPYVIDFGIARELAPAGPREPARRVVGTPSYMAPEQARGQRHLTGPATDVYALGAILYELVSGRRPFAADTCEAIITKAIQEAPEPLRDLDPTVSPALDAVVLRCLEKDPALRYASAADLAAALEGCQAGH